MDWIILAALKTPAFMEKGERFREKDQGAGSFWIVVTLGVLLLALTVGIFLYYKFKNRPRRSRRLERRKAELAAKKESPVRPKSEKKGRRRRSRRNASISETGGLPPRREDATLPYAS